jgi:hypothetical protein
MPFGPEPQCELIGSDCGFEPPLVGAECEPKMPLVCGSGCRCLQAASATRGRIGQVSDLRLGYHRKPISVRPGRCE